MYAIGHAGFNASSGFALSILGLSPDPRVLLQSQRQRCLYGISSASGGGTRGRPHLRYWPMRTSKPSTPVANAARVPTRWRADVERILITRVQIDRRLRVMAREIEQDFDGREMVVISLLNGTVMFLADLVRHLSLPLRLDFIGVSSYRTNTESGELVFTKDLRLDVRGRDVLLVDDILDTGKTMTRVLEKLVALGPRRIRICVLLDKTSRRVEPVHADYVGFEIPDVFVVGYGLDFAERYRNLPFVGVLHPRVYSQPPLTGSQHD